MTELNTCSAVKIIVHCDLGSGMQGHLSITLHVTELDGVVSVDEAYATTLGIGDSRITVHCDLGSGTSGKDICLSLACSGIG